MKSVEVLSILVAIFLVTLSLGDGAPQWRPQGRFGKRLSQRSNNIHDIMTALREVPDESDSLDAWYVEDGNQATDDDMDIYSSLNLQPSSGSRVCIETQFHGVFKCHRRKWSANALLSGDEE